MLGLFVFILIFAIIVPVLLYKLGLYNILAVYFPNLDIIATILSYNSGFKETIFSNLFNTHCKFDTEKHKVFSVSETVINYLSLMGLGFVVLKMSKGDIYTDLANFSVMLLITYMLPNQILEIILNYIHDAYKLNIGWVVAVGLILMAFIIGTEHLILENFAGILRKFFKKLLVDLPRIINKM
jgi:hypothetical protein